MGQGIANLGQQYYQNQILQDYLNPKTTAPIEEIQAYNPNALAARRVALQQQYPGRGIAPTGPQFHYSGATPNLSTPGFSGNLGIQPYPAPGFSGNLFR
jgi:hypothetical protein